MNSNVRKLRKGCLILLSIYIVFSVIFLWQASDKIKYTQGIETDFGKNTNQYVGEITDGHIISQEFELDSEVIDSISIYFATYQRDNTGSLIITLMDTTNKKIIDEKTIDVDSIKNNTWYNLELKKDLTGNNKYALIIKSKGCKEGNAVTIGYQDSVQIKGASLKIDGTVVENAGLGLKVTHMDYSEHTSIYWITFVVLFFILLTYLCIFYYAFKTQKNVIGLKYYNLINKYNFLIKQLVSRDFNTKYKKSMLGIFWSFLNPLLTMAVQYIVFSNIFRFNIENYAVYLLTGIVLYNGFTESTTNGLYSIVGNASLITKVYVPKYIYPISKVLSSTVNLMLSLIPLLLVTVFTGLKLSWALLLLPYGLICLVIFEIGMSMLLSSMMVFFRDIQFLWSVFTMLWMYLTPIIYSLDLLPVTLQKLMKFNPMYYYIDYARTIIIERTSPEPIVYLICAGFSFGMLAFGALVFKKTQDKFILNI